MAIEHMKIKEIVVKCREERQARLERRMQHSEEVRQRKEDELLSEMSNTASSRQNCGPEKEDREEQTEKPWRSLEGSWDESYRESLIDAIKNHKMNEKNVKNVRILLIGPIKAGKSSFLNTVASIDKGRISQVTGTGGAGTSLSKTLKVFRPQVLLKNFRLLDTMGIEDTELGGLNIHDFMFVVKGHVPPDYKFNPVNPISEDSRDFNKQPKNKDKIHCVVFVMDANEVGQENISDGTRKKIKALQTQLMNIDIPRTVLLTKIDVLCEMNETDITNCYRSVAMKNVVDLAAELFNVPRQSIFPVQNYSGELKLEPQKDILPLLALRQMMYYGTDFLNESSAPKSDDEDSS